MTVSQPVISPVSAPFKNRRNLLVTAANSAAFALARKPHRRWDRADRWSYLCGLYGAAARVPSEIVEEFWGVDTAMCRRPPDDCPACRQEPESGAVLCPYHASLVCPACGGILTCQGWCP